MKAIVEQLDAPSQSSFRAIRRRDPRFEFNWHYHRQAELTLICRSQGQRFVGDHIGEYESGDLVLLGPNVPHTWCSQPSRRRPHEAIVVQFLPDFLGADFFALPELSAIGGMLERSSTGLCFADPARSEAAKKLERLVDLAPVSRLMGLVDILHLLSTADATPLSSPGFVPQLRDAQHRVIDRVCREINERFAEPLRQSEIAAMVEMSPARFSQFFRRSTGRSFVQYVNALRVSHACRLLIETELSVTEICFQSGFFNMSNFNRRFREVQRKSPTAFRRTHHRSVE